MGSEGLSSSTITHGRFVVFSPISIDNLALIASEIRSEECSQFTAISDVNSFYNSMQLADKDIYMQVHTEEGLAGIVLGRGLDEGFEDVRLAIYLLKKSRGVGLGHKVVSSFISHCIENKQLVKFSVKVNKTNNRALRLYENIGFSHFNENANDYFLKYMV